MQRLGPIQQKMLLVLLSGIALCLSADPRQSQRVISGAFQGWKKINQFNIKRSLLRLQQQKLVREVKSSDGSMQLVLTHEGRRQAKRLFLFGKAIKFEKPKKWDKKWRIVSFDIPEKGGREFRDIFREHLYALEFYMLHKSVFISPYPFEKPLTELVELYSAQKYVSIIMAVKISHEKKLLRHFFN